MVCTRTTRSSSQRRRSRASSMKRRVISSSLLQFSASTLIATSASRRSSRARYTVAKPPRPEEPHDLVPPDRTDGHRAVVPHARSRRSGFTRPVRPPRSVQLDQQPRQQPHRVGRRAVPADPGVATEPGPLPAGERPVRAHDLLQARRRAAPPPRGGPAPPCTRGPGGRSVPSRRARPGPGPPSTRPAATIRRTRPSIRAATTARGSQTPTCCEPARWPGRPDPGPVGGERAAAPERHLQRPHHPAAVARLDPGRRPRDRASQSRAQASGPAPAPTRPPARRTSGHSPGGVRSPEQPPARTARSPRRRRPSPPGLDVGERLGGRPRRTAATVKRSDRRRPGRAGGGGRRPARPASAWPCRCPSPGTPASSRRSRSRCPAWTWPGARASADLPEAVGPTSTRWRGPGAATAQRSGSGRWRTARLSSAKPGKRARRSTLSHSSTAAGPRGTRLMTGPKNDGPSGGSIVMIGVPTSRPVRERASSPSARMTSSQEVSPAASARAGS